MSGEVLWTRLPSNLITITLRTSRYQFRLHFLLLLFTISLQFTFVTFPIHICEVTFDIKYVLIIALIFINLF